MRLNLLQVHQIKSTVKTIFGDEAKLWVFGAQLGDRQRSSDVELYIEAKSLGNANGQKTTLLSLLHQDFSNLKIDVSIREPQQMLTDLHRNAIQNGVAL
ncbi:MAG: hypothetical protein V3V31_01350 [Methylococcales bacterium]